MFPYGHLIRYLRDTPPLSNRTDTIRFRPRMLSDRFHTLRFSPYRVPHRRDTVGRRDGTKSNRREYRIFPHGIPEMLLFDRGLAPGAASRRPIRTQSSVYAVNGVPLRPSFIQYIASSQTAIPPWRDFRFPTVHVVHGPHSQTAECGEPAGIACTVVRGCVRTVGGSGGAARTSSIRGRR